MNATGFFTKLSCFAFDSPHKTADDGIQQKGGSFSILLPGSLQAD
ncbi:hypothetical protein HMPREF9103_03136 [Lentilactobacillus parafarraginis F0439]|uniref:Uncharacterized protein n=1 Tax=Lentilactobacillus parafarraginis F0439 TaxID=797515 RepID=G9ZTQ1_9LACO|nr:hypothetical protein HMPREF9103_03136 [Lentilactobacillus parafarraginis F0439]